MAALYDTWPGNGLGLSYSPMACMGHIANINNALWPVTNYTYCLVTEAHVCDQLA